MQRFTAVVGPNGSGKSNGIDAMLFVFGRRAQQIRLKKVTERIHNSASVAAAAAEQNHHDHVRPKKKQTLDTPDGTKEQFLIDRASVSVFFQEIIDPVSNASNQAAIIAKETCSLRFSVLVLSEYEALNAIKLCCVIEPVL